MPNRRTARAELEPLPFSPYAPGCACVAGDPRSGVALDLRAANGARRRAVLLVVADRARIEEITARVPLGAS